MAAGAGAASLLPSSWPSGRWPSGGTGHTSGAQCLEHTEKFVWFYLSWKRIWRLAYSRPSPCVVRRKQWIHVCWPGY